MFRIFLALLSRLFFFTGSLSDGSSYPRPLPKEEEAACLRRAKEGDREAYDKLIRHNMRLVAHIAKKYTGAAETDDMISVGAIGLMKAVTTFEEGHGTRLATFAARCIENEILMLIRAGKKHKGTMSLSDPVGTDKDGNELTIMDLLFEKEEKVFAGVEKSLVQEKLLAAVEALLTEREAEIVCMRYALRANPPYAQREVAKKLGISRSYVSRIEKKALEKLRAGLKEEDFYDR